MRLTVDGDFSQTHFFLYYRRVQFNRPATELEDLNSCDYLCANLHLDFLKSYRISRWSNFLVYEMNIL